MTTDVILLGHGSHRTRATDLGLREIHRRLQRRLDGEARVALGFFEFLHPTLAETVAELAGAGVRQAILMPYFLFVGREIQRDIPRELAHLREQYPTLEVTMAATLGVHPNMIEVAAERVRCALAGVGQVLPTAGGCLPRRGETGRVGVVLVNRGVRRQFDDGARLGDLCALLQGALGGDTLVEPALAENSPQTVEATAAHLVDQGARRVVVMPYLHFPGKVLASVAEGTERARAAHPDVKHYLASTLCVDDRIVEVCVARIREQMAEERVGIDA
jgi:sirohydrochlorin cobaltochelatase